MKKLNEIIQVLFRNRDSGIFRQIPLNVPGKLFTSPMPSGAYDPGNRLLKIYEHNKIQHVFMLVTDAEIANKARRNLLSEYEKRGITSSRYVIEDFQAPSLEMIKTLVCEALGRLRNRQRILVHCHAGVGRTSLAVACIAMVVEKMTAPEAVAHVKANMMVNITTEQSRLIEKFGQFIESKAGPQFCE